VRGWRRNKPRHRAERKNAESYGYRFVDEPRYPLCKQGIELYGIEAVMAEAEAAK